MKRLTGEKDYLCIAGTASEITKTLNKIGCRHDLTILSTDNKDGIVTVIVERRLRPGPSRCSEEASA